MARRLVASGKSLVLCAEALRRHETAAEAFSIERHLLRTTARICGVVREILSARDVDPEAALAAAKLLTRGGGNELARVCRIADAEDAHVDLRGEGLALPIPEVLGVVSSLHKTGMLWVESATENFLVQLSDGSVAFVQGDCPPPRMRIGEILVDQGAASEEAVQQALEKIDRRKNLLGKSLLRVGLISPGQLQEALVVQAQEIFNRLFDAEDARFEFLTGMKKLLDEDLRLNVTQLLLESARLRDETEDPLDQETRSAA